MNEVITITDDFNMATAKRHVHLMSNSAITYPLPSGSVVQTSVEAGVHHLRAEIPMRGPVDIQCEGWLMPKRFVLWTLTEGERMSEIIVKAAEEYWRLFGGLPGYAFVRSLPRSIEHGRAISFMGDDILVFPAEWMFGRSVAVGYFYSPLPYVK